MTIGCLLLQSQVIEFPWTGIQQYETDDEGMSFNFEFIRTGKKPRWVKIFSSYVSNVNVAPLVVCIAISNWVQILYCRVESKAISFAVHHLSSLSDMNQNLAVESGGHVLMSSLCSN